MSVDHATVHKSQRQRLLDLLLDMEWHEFPELNRVAGIRYGARLLELKRLGYRIEDQPFGEDGKKYRLLSRDAGVPRPKRVKVFMHEDDAKVLLREGRLTPSAYTAVRGAVESFAQNAEKL